MESEASVKLFLERKITFSFPECISVTYPTIQNWALLVLIPDRRFCVHSRTQWVSPTNSPVRLGVSPTTTIPTGFEALFPGAGILGHMVCLVPQLFLPGYLHTNVGLPSLPAAASPTQPSSCYLATCPLCPGCPSPSLLPF